MLTEESIAWLFFEYRTYPHMVCLISVPTEIETSGDTQTSASGSKSKVAPEECKAIPKILAETDAPSLPGAVADEQPPIPPLVSLKRIGPQCVCGSRCLEDDSLKFCLDCGKSRSYSESVMPKCVACGYIFPSITSKYCGQCGQKRQREESGGALEC